MAESSIWPVFIPAEKDWLELYTDAPEINFQASTAATPIHHTSDKQRWNVALPNFDCSQHPQPASLSSRYSETLALMPTGSGQLRRHSCTLNEFPFCSALHVGRNLTDAAEHDAASNHASLGIGAPLADVTVHQRLYTFFMSMNPGYLRAISSM
ncbi:uncharacterized protein PHACADRAFT_203449 [Phanerochaete carnosa HHB-10118-sp]|uniref:Uncharacterized protein n=1 Tax=Phanerochaete carnosa (strain HHB-10118-sp) TaxID=650164 RepID=K5W8A5_PHACS|nr:uncharacterized protein PHACADRAFT_203449 [Phanerochaete carnosa HHB-10118-sp]EKM60188.1 hypothetical protein PHACADRAFT_203449 [Phanerochaete carnosa HHB-10118-sp]